MKIALAQINTTVGELPATRRRSSPPTGAASRRARSWSSFPELALTGYPPRDLLLERRFVPENLEVLDRLAAATGATGLLVGFVGRNETRPGREATNAVALLQHGRIVATRAKTLLPTYDVFDEDRYFEPARRICRSSSTAKDRADHLRGRLERRGFLGRPALPAQSGGGTGRGRRAHSLQHLRLALASGQERDAARNAVEPGRQDKLPGGLLQLVGGNDELVFDGASLVFDGRAG